VIPETQRAERIARIRAERAAAGRGPYIETESVYALLAAVLSADEPERSSSGVEND
jgi:hypothetical protein